MSDITRSTMRLVSLWRSERIGARDVTAEEYDRILEFLQGLEEYEDEQDKKKKGNKGSGGKQSEINAGAIPESVVPFRYFSEGEL